MVINKILSFFIFTFLFVSCVQKPTRVFTKDEFKNQVSVQESAPHLKPLEITDKTIILDARPQFQYVTSHIPNSYHLSWTEFLKNPKKKSGYLRKDYREITKRLARLGISPETPLIIVDQGLEGKGEAGRLAWTLYYYGVKNIQLASIRALKTKLTIKDSEPQKPLNFWKAQIQDNIFIKENEFQKKSKFADPLSGETLFIDVRSSKEFSLSPHNFAMNIEWKEFFNDQGRPQVNIIKRLSDIGVNQDKEVILISDKGVRSAAVTMALTELGFFKVRNYIR